MSSLRTIHIEGGGAFTVAEEIAEAFITLCKVSHLSRPNPQTYPVYLTSVGTHIIACIKEVRTITGKLLKEAKQMVDKVRGANGYSKEHQLIGFYSYEENLEMRIQFNSIGCAITLPSALELLAEAGDDEDG